MGDLTEGPLRRLHGLFGHRPRIEHPGIQAVADGSALLVAHTAQGRVNHVDPATGVSEAVAGVNVPSVYGILLEGRTLWAVRNFDNQIAQYKLARDLRAGSPRPTVTSHQMHVPTTVARVGDRLATVNAKFDTGIPPTAHQYEVVVLDR